MERKEANSSSEMTQKLNLNILFAHSQGPIYALKKFVGFNNSSLEVFVVSFFAWILIVDILRLFIFVLHSRSI